MNGIKTKISFLIALGLTAATPMAWAANISLGIPGISPEAPPSDFVGAIYKFAIGISGVLALGAIVFGGVKYMMAAGNPSGQTEGKEWVKGAVFGLILLFGAYFILNVINPDIAKLNKLPTLAPIPQPNPAGLEDRSACNTCAASQVCVRPNGSLVWACTNRPSGNGCTVNPDSCPAGQQCTVNLSGGPNTCG